MMVDKSEFLFTDGNHTDGISVYVTVGGEKYHMSRACAGGERAHESTLNDVHENGSWEPCQTCTSIYHTEDGKPVQEADCKKVLGGLIMRKDDDELSDEVSSDELSPPFVWGEYLDDCLSALVNEYGEVRCISAEGSDVYYLTELPD